MFPATIGGLFFSLQQNICLHIRFSTLYIWRIYKSCLGTAPIYAIQYDIYLVYIRRIYETHFDAVLLYIIQYNLYMTYIWIRPRSILIYTVQYNLYLAHI